MIKHFINDYYFLHTFYPCTVPFDGLDYPSAEHAYQASKTQDPKLRLVVRDILDGAAVRNFAKRGLRQTLEPEQKLLNMIAVQESKFFNNVKLAKQLLDTGSLELVYTEDSYQDRFWGVCRGKGRNLLGIILVDIRTRIREAVTRSKRVRISKVSFRPPTAPAFVMPPAPGQ